MWRGEQVIIEDVQAHPDYVSHRDIATRAELRGVHSTPLMGRNGELLGVLTTFYRQPYHASERDKRILDLYTRQAADFIERLRSQAALQKNEAHYRAIGEAIDFGIWMCNAEGRATYISDSFLRMVGMTNQECLDLGWGGLLHPEDAEATMAAWNQCVATGGVWDREHRFRGADGQWHFVLARGVPVRNVDGTVVGWAGINLDIDRLKQAEEALRDADRRKDEFLATLAHELRNPLAPVRNAVQILQMKSEAQQELKWASEVIERQVQAMTRLIDDLMDVSRISRGRIELKREPVDLDTIITGALETTRPFIEQQRHELTVRLPDKPVLLDADVTRLTQVVLNLLNNAAKYTEPGGEISLEADFHGNDIVISVRDTGVGIREKDLPTVFQMFCQIETSLSRSQGGLGIGLCLVKRLVEMHGGSIEVRSHGPGTGSEFIVRLPVVRKCESCVPHLPSGDGELTSRFRILVADDNRDAAASIAMLLQFKGNNVRTVFDGQEAVEAAGEFRPDVVLMDIGMPRMNGYEAAQEIRSQPWGQQIVLVAVTGWGQEDDRRRSNEVGFDHHMVKPVDPSELMRLLASLPVYLQAVP